MLDSKRGLKTGFLPGIAFLFVFTVILLNLGVNNTFALTEAECRVCHGGPEGDMINVHHAFYDDVTYTCLSCHKKIGGKVISYEVIRDCTVCHSSAGHEADHDQTFLPSPDCTGCHVPNVFTEHVTNRALGCDICHSSTDPNVQDAITRGSNGQPVFCADCHGAAAGQHEADHDKTMTDSPDCLECHVNNVFTEHVTNQSLGCNVCHSSTDPNVQAAIAKGQGPDGQIVYCSDCHGPDAGLHEAAHDRAMIPYADCGQCHAPNVVTEHVTNMGMDCAVCHGSSDQVIQDVITRGKNGETVYCAECHVQFGNHVIQHDQTFLPLPDCSDCHVANVVTEHENSTIPTFCFTCHTSPNELVFTAIDEGMAENPVHCDACHPTYHAGQNQSPVADAGPDVTVAVGQSMSFSGAGSYDPDGQIVDYFWDFGDGATAAGINTSHTYSAPGNYTVTLTVTDNDGAADSDTAFITVEADGPQNQPPVADAGPDKTAEVGQSVSFSGSGSYDPDGTIVDYTWNFGDGQTGSGMTTSHTYTSAGSFTATLTVTDNDGATDSDMAVVTVNPPSGRNNLALNRPATASDYEGSSYGPAQAVDGNMTTRWWTRSGDDEWIRVDLGSTYRVSKVVIHWHSNYAEEYQVEVSADGRRWRRVSDIDHGNGGTDELTFSERDARYVRVKCRKDRSDGYSIYELEVYQ